MLELVPLHLLHTAEREVTRHMDARPHATNRAAPIRAPYTGTADKKQHMPFYGKTLARANNATSPYEPPRPSQPKNRAEPSLATPVALPVPWALLFRMR